MHGFFYPAIRFVDIRQSVFFVDESIDRIFHDKKYLNKKIKIFVCLPELLECCIIGDHTCVFVCCKQQDAATSLPRASGLDAKTFPISDKSLVEQRYQGHRPSWRTLIGQKWMKNVT